MSALPVISHHLFVAAIDEPTNSPPAKVDAIDARAIKVEVLDWTEPVPEPVGSATRPSRQSSKP